jgi:cytochrome bd ubiquinol oxidase subunit I
VMRTEDAVTDASGVWVSLGVVVVLYSALGIATVLVLRAMSRRWRAAETDEVDVPYGPRPAAPEPPEAPA